jgi:mevalonate kinase
MLGGEYAVLDGGPALVLAVNIGVRCETAPSASLRIETPDGDDRFVRAALRHVGAPNAHYTFYNVGLEAFTTKPGLGGSAAATVAAVLAGGGVGTEAYEVHHAVQGSGSGADVAASLYGGLIRFEPSDPIPSIQQLAPVHPVVVFSGASARTGPRVSRYQSWAPSKRADFVKKMADAVDAFPLDPVAVTATMGALLLSMARDAGLDYDTPALEAIRTLAARESGAARASGAGGGDCSVAFFENESQANAFRHAVEAAGFMIVPVEPAEATGLLGTEIVSRPPRAQV